MSNTSVKFKNFGDALGLGAQELLKGFGKGAGNVVDTVVSASQIAQKVGKDAVDACGSKSVKAALRQMNVSIACAREDAGDLVSDAKTALGGNAAKTGEELKAAASLIRETASEIGDSVCGNTKGLPKTILAKASNTAGTVLETTADAIDNSGATRVAKRLRTVGKLLQENSKR